VRGHRHGLTGPLLAATGVLAIAAALGGCEGRIKDPADVVGRWSASVPGRAKAAKARIDFHRDGTFSARDLPEEQDFPDVDRLGRYDGRGTWRLNELEQQRVELSFTEIHGRAGNADKYGEVLNVGEWPGRRSLIIYLGDPDSGNIVYFKRAR
jgi:hypothetical protein